MPQCFLHFALNTAKSRPPMPLVVLIPALKPSDDLLKVVDALAGDDHVEKLILVNDGSPAESDPVFNTASRHPKVTLLRHAVNLGKGAALRTGMNHFLCECGTDDVLVTADADGQHLPADILAVGAKATTEPGALVLGCRAFAGEVPLRSRFGNTLTRKVFAFLVGREISDTQTGLRAIPRQLMPALMRVRASGYEFELEMLILAARSRVSIESVPIETVYEEGNRSSHFNPLWDSMRIYFIFARFVSSSLLAALVDFVVYALTLMATGSIGWSIGAARVVSGTMNFALNKSFVFRSNGGWWSALARYAALVVLLGSAAWALISVLTHQFGWSPYLAKVVVEGLLFVCSFAVQRDLVFNGPPAGEAESEPVT